MRKPYSPEIECKVFSKFISGESVREISKSVGVSTGYVSNCIENLSSKIENGDASIIHEFFKIIKKMNLQPKDAFLGFSLFSIMSKHKLDAEQIHHFVESVLLNAKQNELSAEELVKLCKKLFAIQSSSDVPLEDISDHCDNLVSNKKQLEEKIIDLNSKHKQSKDGLSHMLEKKGLIEKQVEKTEHILEFLHTIGMNLSDLDSFSSMFQNAKAQNYDLSKIISYLNQNKSLESAIKKKQSSLDEIEEKTRKLEKKHEDMSLRHENLTLRHDSMLKSIKSVESLSQNGVSANAIVTWQQIFDSFGMGLDEFEKELKTIGDKNKINANLDTKKSKLEKEVTSLEKKKSWLKGNVDDLSSEISNKTEFGKKNLKKITDHAESQINSTVIMTKKSLENFMKYNQNQLNVSQRQFMDYFLDLTAKLEELLEHSHKAEYSLAKMESLKPLESLTHGKFNLVTAVPQIISILDVLDIHIPDSGLDNSLLHSDIKQLHKRLLDLLSRG